MGENLVEELIQSHVKEFTRKQERDKKIKHRKRAMQGRILKVPNFLAIRNQQTDADTASHSEKPITSSTNTPATVTIPKRSSDRNRRSPWYYGFERPAPDSTILPTPKRPRQAVDLENFQPPPESIVESVQHIAEGQPVETNISPQIGDV